MKNKGFTLIEMLAVMIILSVILFLVLPNVASIINLGKENIYAIEIKEIIDAAYDYTISNTSVLPEYGEKKYITLNKLKKEGFADGSIIDTKTGEEFPNDLVISVENVGKSYDVPYTNNYSIKGDYLYYIELDRRDDPEYINNKPTIEITGYKTSLFKSVNLNGEFTVPECSALSNEQTDITDDVVINIIYESNIVDSVDTSVAGIYYINYCVVDSNGYSNCAIFNVVVVDNERPTIRGLDSLVIDKSETTYDLMEGVSCTDNSGKCKISIIENIRYGISGIYTAEYIATDPSGNTFSQKRVIKIS